MYNLAPNENSDSYIEGRLFMLVHFASDDEDVNWETYEYLCPLRPLDPIRIEGKNSGQFLYD